MKAEESLSKAAALVGGDRAKQHGDKMINHQNIATMWGAYLKLVVNKAIRERKDFELSAADVAALMALLKIARTQAGAYNDDDYVDGAAYFAIFGELNEKV